MPPRLLDGARILDLTRATAGPFGSMLLADLGAEVIKVETPSEGINPREPIERPEYRIGGMDLFFISMNRNKKSIALDLKAAEGLELFYQLVKKVDVVYDNFRPGVTDALKIGYSVLSELHPAIICCSVSGFGSSGPLTKRAGFDITLLAQSGILSYIGKKDNRGLAADIKLSVADCLGGTYAALAMASALNHQRATGKGCRIEVGMYDALLSWLHAFALYPLNFGIERDIREHQLWGAFMTKDRPLAITGHRTGPFKKLCRALGREDLPSDERFSTAPRRVEHIGLLRSIVEQELLKKTRAEWVQVFEETGVCYAEVCEMPEALVAPQTIERNMVVTAEHPEYGPVKLLGNPIKAEGFAEEFQAPPLFGEHTGEVLATLLGYGPDDLDDLKARGIVG